MIEFSVPGLPAPKKRPRVAFKDRNGRLLKKPHTYTPGKTGAYEARVAWMAREAVLLKGWQHTRAWLSLEVRAFVPSAKAGDGDNFLKTVADALQGILYENDRQILDWSVVVRPALAVEPQISVKVAPLFDQKWFPELPKKRRSRVVPFGDRPPVAEACA
jgi:Holliday junction resolvase RusA-like endonuclease